MTDSGLGHRSRRIVLITSDGLEHHYVANRLMTDVGLDAVVVDHGRPETRTQRVRYLLDRYTPSQLVSRFGLRLIAAMAGDERRRLTEVSAVLGDSSKAFARPDLVHHVNGINTSDGRAVVESLEPNLLLIYGTGIVGRTVLGFARDRALNLHTGMSPWYRGSDCAFWPLYNRELDMVGATVHECTSRVDGGEIYARAPARLRPGDGVFAAFARSVEGGAELYVTTVLGALDGTLEGTAQDIGSGREYRAADKRIHHDVNVRVFAGSGAMRRAILAESVANVSEAAPVSMPPLSVTIVSHQARDLLASCLRSIREHPYTVGEMEVVVLDNASDDGSVELVESEFPEVVLLAETARRGFGANQNRAVAASRGELVFMLNPDATVHEGTIDRLALALVARSGVVAAGGPIVNSDGSWRQRHPHPFPSPWSPYVKALGLRRLGIGMSREADITGDAWPSGGACMIARSAFDEVGGFDEDFFMYAEDTDLFARLVDAGGLIAWVDDAVVTHPYPDETAALSQRRETENFRGELRYLRKHRGTAAAWVFRVGVVVDAGLRALLFSIPGFNRLGKHHGKSAAYNRRVQVARLTAALAPHSRPGLQELAAEWNRNHAADPADAMGVATITDRKLVVFDSGTTWDGTWMAFQHIAVHLAARTPVLFVDAPESPVYSLRSRGKLRLRSRHALVADNLYRLTPAAPPGLTRPGVHRITAVIVRRSVRRAVRELGLEVGAVLANLSHANVFSVAGTGRRIYYASDDFEAGASLMGRPAARLATLDAELAGQADAIVAISPAIAARYEAMGYDPVLIPNGVEVEAFADVENSHPPGDVDLPAPVAGFVGLIGDRIDLAHLEAVADKGISMVLVGPKQATFSQADRFDRLADRPNVVWVGEKPFAALGSYLGVMDVGMVPYTDSAFNRASFPLKMLEYLAAGRAVVATPLPAVSWLHTDLITVAETPEDFAAAVADATAEEPDPDAIAERRAFASDHSWEKRVDQLAEVLGLPVA